jgi:hypothetical protein
MVDIKAAIGQPPHNDLSGFFRVRNTTGKVIAVEQVGTSLPRRAADAPDQK